MNAPTSDENFAHTGSMMHHNAYLRQTCDVREPTRTAPNTPKLKFGFRRTMN
jgi:hypothetical protein